FDFDGNSTVSRIVSVETDSNSISNWVSVYPNPVSTKSFHVEVSAVKQGDFVTFRLTDVTGKKVLDARHITGDGVYKSEIPCDAMPTGMYILTVTHKSRKSYQRIVIQR
ncbi:MAG TPA: T9SS type A sorting domain-containing protein, partial [Cyclobacteriaceae bacterium]|nr:T9SS type A sorting domain-containing protein [Cyclobacteriaceae bacterium]